MVGLDGTLSALSAPEMADARRLRGDHSALHADLVYAQAVQHYVADLLYDLSYGVQTSRVVASDQLEFPDPDVQQHSSRYRATPARIIEAGLSALLEHSPDAREFPLVDYGCGAGRVLVTAAYLGFKNLVGLEFSPPLLKLCRQNREKLLKLPTRPHIEVIGENAATYSLPPETRACYLFDPFDGPVLEGTMERIVESVNAHPRPLFLVTYYLDEAYLGSRGFRKVDQRWGACLYRYVQ